MKNSKKLLKVFFFALSFVFVTVAYQNCGGGGSANGGGAVVSAESTNGDIIPIPNTKTTSVVRATRVLDNLVSCLGTQEASSGGTSARQTFINNRGTVSEEGLANSFTQPMGKAVVAVAAEVCQDLYEREDDDNNQKHIFIEVDFDADTVSSAELTNGVKRIARSCWGRNATSDEVNTILSDVSSNFSGAQDSRATVRNKMIYICTAMAASFSAYEM